MDVCLNDWSLASDNDILANWEAVLNFRKLLYDLEEKGNARFLAPSNLWDMSVSGYDIRKGCKTDGTTIDHDKRSLLLTLFGKFSCQLDGFPIAGIDDTMAQPSSSIGHATAELHPVLSCTFDDTYKKDTLKVWLKENENSEPSKEEVTNLFEEKPDNYQFFADTSACREIDPLENPMWNVELVREYLEGKGFIRLDAQERSSRLKKYGKIVAEMNGWAYDDRVSKLNNNKGQMRDIFSSAFAFTSYPTAYLSIDMEGPDLAFELHDRNGKHKGERAWDGKKKEPKKHHDIRIK